MGHEMYGAWGKGRVLILIKDCYKAPYFPEHKSQYMLQISSQFGDGI